jgi:hypothetical protein
VSAPTEQLADLTPPVADPLVTVTSLPTPVDAPVEVAGLGGLLDVG